MPGSHCVRVVTYTSGGVPCEWDDYACPHKLCVSFGPGLARVVARDGHQARRADRLVVRQPRDSADRNSTRESATGGNTSWPS